MEFSVDKITDIVWQDQAFANLVLPPAHKEMIHALVESHRGAEDKEGFDDFIAGKGKGLIINLFGPPGVSLTCIRRLRSF